LRFVLCEWLKLEDQPRKNIQRHLTDGGYENLVIRICADEAV